MKDKKVMIGGGLLLVAVFWFYVKPNYVDAKPAVVYTQEQIANAPRPTLFIGKTIDAHGAASGETGVVFNLKSSPSNPNYARVIMALEFTDPDRTYVGTTSADAITAKNIEFAHHMGPEMHKVLDAVTRVFGSHTIDELSTTEGKEMLKTELMKALNHELHGHEVEAIYFESFITQ
jgi:flagellar protein FliL